MDSNTIVSTLLGDERNRAQSLSLRIEELAMSLESAFPELDELVEKHGDTGAKLRWKHVRDKFDAIAKIINDQR